MNGEVKQDKEKVRKKTRGEVLLLLEIPVDSGMQWIQGLGLSLY